MNTTASAPAEAQSVSPGRAHLRSGRQLLNLVVAAYEEVDEDDILEAVLGAQQQIEAFFDARDKAGHGISEEPEAAYDALDLVMLARVVLQAGLQVENDITMEPVRAALRMAAEKLSVAQQETAGEGVLQ